MNENKFESVSQEELKNVDGGSLFSGIAASLASGAVYGAASLGSRVQKKKDDLDAGQIQNIG